MASRSLSNEPSQPHAFPSAFFTNCRNFLFILSALTLRPCPSVIATPSGRFIPPKARGRRGFVHGEERRNGRAAQGLGSSESRRLTRCGEQLLLVFMRPILFALLAAIATTVPARSAGSLDDDVFGNYVGFTAGSAFKFRITRGLSISASYRVRGVPVRENYRLRESGRFTGIWRARGRLIGTVSGRATNSRRSINATGRARLSTGAQRRFSVRIRFGPGTVSIITRGAGGVFRSSGVKS